MRYRYAVTTVDRIFGTATNSAAPEGEDRRSGVLAVAMVTVVVGGASVAVALLMLQVLDAVTSALA